MKIADILGYQLHIPTTGGKAGAGRNVTSSVQVRLENIILKNIRFKTTDFKSRSNAIQKARDFVISDMSKKRTGFHVANSRPATTGGTVS